ncbi:MAG: hypothetical protein HZC28_19040 [Spirochaetes bacterium]|nr:hypothetical protein [Spirochaetota bacterium]
MCKKITIAAVSVLLAAGWSSAYAAVNEIGIVLGTGGKGSGITFRAKDGESENIPAERDGRQCVRGIKPAPGTANVWYLYFLADDADFRDGAAPKSRITVEYFDEGTGKLRIAYDSSDESVTEVKNAPGSWKRLPGIELENSKQWKTYTVTVSDALFKKRCNGADIRLEFYEMNAGPYISKLSIKKPSKPATPAGGTPITLTLASTPVEKGLKLIPETPEGKNSAVTKDGREAWACAPGTSAGKYMYFQLTDETFRNGSAPSVEIIFEYFDEGEGAIHLEYDSMLEAKIPGGFKPAAIAALTGSKTWKTARVKIADARFGGRCNNFDFRVAIPKNTDVAVASVGIAKK